MLTKSQSLFMARPEAKRARICSTTRRRAEPQALKNFLRHAKAHQVSKPVYGETRSQACQDLLDQAKASRPLSVIKISKASKGSKVSKPAQWRDKKSSLLEFARPCEAEQKKKIYNFYTRRQVRTFLLICQQFVKLFIITDNVQKIGKGNYNTKHV